MANHGTKIPMLKPVILTILLFSFAGIVRSQPTAITKDEFFQTYYSAIDKAGEVDRRVDSKLENYRNGTVSESERWFYEYQLPSKRRFVYTKTTNGKTSLTEEINVDENNFCRVSGKWEKRATNCITGFSALKSQLALQVLGVAASKYTVEDEVLDGSTVRLFKERTTYRNQSQPNNDGGKLRYYERTFWLDANGVILKQVTRSGFVNEKDITSLWIDVFEYNPKALKIESPIN